MEGNILNAIMTALAVIMEGIIALFAPVESLFWTGSALTFLGSLALVGVGIGVVLLILGIVQRYISLRGR